MKQTERQSHQSRHQSREGRCCAGYRGVIRHSKGSSCLDGSGQYLPGNQMKPLCLHTFQVGFTVSQGSRIDSFPGGHFPDQVIDRPI